MKRLIALRDCIFREPFPGSLAVAHINRSSQKSPSERNHHLHLRKKKKLKIMQLTLSIQS